MASSPSLPCLGLARCGGVGEIKRVGAGLSCPLVATAAIVRNCQFARARTSLLLQLMPKNRDGCVPHLIALPVRRSLFA